MKKIVYFTRFLPSLQRGGGSRRMLQIEEVLNAQGFHVQVVSSAQQDYIDANSWKKINQQAANIEEWTGGTAEFREEYKSWSSQRRPGAFRLGEISKEWVRSFPGLDTLPLAIMDDPIYFAPLFETLHQQGVPVISICHNIETLAPTQVSDDPNRSLFLRELDLSARCASVITISREETVLLNNLGIETIFLPYYPVQPVAERFLSVRQKREKKQRKLFKKSSPKYLLLGNALNLETRNGMEKFITSWASQQMQNSHGKLSVAGLKSEQHLQAVNAQHPGVIELLGTLSDNDLDQLLEDVTACICYQEAGGGALTRIVEMLVAGVPILANSHAARTYYQTNGLVEFPNLPGVGKALTEIEAAGQTLPPLPSPDIDYPAKQITQEIMKIIQ